MFTGLWFSSDGPKLGLFLATEKEWKCFQETHTIWKQKRQNNITEIACVKIKTNKNEHEKTVFLKKSDLDGTIFIAEMSLL